MAVIIVQDFFKLKRKSPAFSFPGSPCTSPFGAQSGMTPALSIWAAEEDSPCYLFNLKS